MGIFLIMVGFAINAVSGVVILVKAFRLSVGWGLAVMFIPFAGLYFVLNHWNDTKTPFLAGIGGGVLMMLGILGGAASTPEPRDTVAAREPSEERRATYASAAAPVPSASYEPPRSAYQPPATYTPSYNPPPQPAAVATDTQAPEDDWRPKPKYEQVYVDRDTNLFYGEKCKKRPENVYRIPRSVALMQGMTEVACR